MDEDLPTEFDVIVVGTGMAESIVAAAASRVGQKVLHLDRNPYYGDLWASFNFNGIHDWIKSVQLNNVPEDSLDVSSLCLSEDCSVLEIRNPVSPFSNVHEEWFVAYEEEENLTKTVTNLVIDLKLEEPAVAVEDKTAEDSPISERDIVEKDAVNAKKIEEICWNRNKLEKNSRKFNLDLAPKLLFAKGSLVELLISSNIGRYTEFRCVTRVLTWINDRLKPVPCSRADVFSTTDVSVVEKRMLMKLLTSFAQSQESSKDFEGFQDKTFLEFLKSKKLPNNLVHYVLHAIASGTEKTSFKEGLSRSQLFLSSLGRYSNSPFLWPMYGSGELPQSFCRLCAIFGGLYHLHKGAGALIISKSSNQCEGIVAGSQKLSASHVVLGVSSFPRSFFQVLEPEGISRGIFIIDRSILAADKEPLTLLQFPTDGNLVTVIEVGPATCACPSDSFVVHMTCSQKTTAVEDLKPVVNLLFKTKNIPSKETEESHSVINESEKVEPLASIPGEDTKPQVLWALYFNVLDSSPKCFSSDIPSNVHLCSGPNVDLDFDSAVQQAKLIFSKICPDEEFLPRAPDPDEIVTDDANFDNQDGLENNTNEEEKLSSTEEIVSEEKDDTSNNTEVERKVEVSNPVDIPVKD